MILGPGVVRHGIYQASNTVAVGHISQSHPKAPNSVQYGFGYAIQSLWITRFDPYSPLRKHRWYPLHGLMAGKSSPSEEVRGRSIERMDQKAQRARELHRSHLPKGGHRENLVPLSVKCHVQGPRTRRGHGRTSSQAKVQGIQTQ